VVDTIIGFLKVKTAKKICVGTRNYSYNKVNNLRSYIRVKDS